MVLSDKLNDGPSDGLFYNDFGSVYSNRITPLAWVFRSSLTVDHLHGDGVI